ncbi:MAG TPA: hypothetical protein VG253_08725 [Streptosporangiaceae bacterium]|jgi:hypothetical protein|nr:hypothetical protein [Streptosporangiaceae bacterium]
MSFADRLLLWFHIGFVIFTIGPVTIATLSTSRYIRTGNVTVVRFLARITVVFGIASLGVLLFGIVAAQALHDISKAWATSSMTLFVVALVLLVLIMRDQRRAIHAMGGPPASVHAAAGASGAGGVAVDEGSSAATAQEHAAGTAAQPPESAPADPEPSVSAASGGADGAAAARMERGRIASYSGVVTLIWLVILVLMVWNS